MTTQRTRTCTHCGSTYSLPERIYKHTWHVDGSLDDTYDIDYFSLASEDGGARWYRYDEEWDRFGRFVPSWQMYETHEAAVASVLAAYQQRIEELDAERQAFLAQAAAAKERAMQ